MIAQMVCTDTPANNQGIQFLCTIHFLIKTSIKGYSKSKFNDKPYMSDCCQSISVIVDVT